MGRNEIRLRRQKMSAGRIARHRNYGELMERHERGIKLRRIAVAAIYFLIIISLLILFLIVRWQEQKQNSVKQESALVVKINRDFPDKAISDFKPIKNSDASKKV